MRRGRRSRSLARWGLLLAAVAAVLAHVCDSEAGAGHALAAHHRPADTGPAPPAEGSDVHVASCDGIKPASTGPLVSTAQSRPLTIVRLERIWWRDPLPAFPPALHRSALFVLYASFLI